MFYTRLSKQARRGSKRSRCVRLKSPSFPAVSFKIPRFEKWDLEVCLRETRRGGAPQFQHPHRADSSFRQDLPPQAQTAQKDLWQTLLSLWTHLSPIRPERAQLWSPRQLGWDHQVLRWIWRLHPTLQIGWKIDKERASFQSIQGCSIGDWGSAQQPTLASSKGIINRLRRVSYAFTPS